MLNLGLTNREGSRQVVVSEVDNFVADADSPGEYYPVLHKVPCVIPCLSQLDVSQEIFVDRKDLNSAASANQLHRALVMIGMDEAHENT